MTLIRTWSTELHLREDTRELSGVLVPYNAPATVREFGKTYTEDFAAGAFAGDHGRAAEIELCALHPRSGRELPVGITTALTETAAGLDWTGRLSETSFADDVLVLCRDRALRCLSAGFAEVPGGNRWHTRDRVTRTRATLDHVALVRRGAYPGARLRTAHLQHDPLLLLARMRLR